MKSQDDAQPLIASEVADGVARVVLNVRRIEARIADRLAEQLIEAFRQTNVAVMDFTRVDFIDSVGMKALMTVLLHCRKTEGVCVLHGVSEDIMSVFVITRLNKLLPITGNLEEALGRVRDLVAQSRERVGNMKA